uniref:Uncharacterized protein n=1 Tax=viral metagenome TaxID=1070528 RepID=A0A6H1Z9H0_9ZZZZ
MKNKDIDRYNLTDKEKAELRHLRNLRRRLKPKGCFEPQDKARLRELQLNGQKD